MSVAARPQAALPHGIEDPIARIEAAAHRISSTTLERSDLQFREAFVALRIRDYEQIELQIGLTRRRLLDQSRQLEARLPQVFWPSQVPAVETALRAHAREHGAEATAELLGQAPQRFGPLRGAPLSPLRQRARETAREAALRLSSLHATRERLGRLRELASSRPYLASLRAELAAISQKLRRLPSIPALHHDLAHAVGRAGGLPAVVSRLSPPTLALAEQALRLGRSWVEGLSR